MAVYTMGSPYVTPIGTVRISHALGSSELEQPVPLECRITDSNGPLAEWDPEHASKIDSYDVQCHISHMALHTYIHVFDGSS